MWGTTTDAAACTSVPRLSFFFFFFLRDDLPWTKLIQLESDCIYRQPKLIKIGLESCQNSRNRPWLVATLGILCRVFLFHFEIILFRFGLFRVFRDVSINTGRNSRFGQHEVCALKKKKKFLKPKQICILYTEKSQKEKNEKKKKMKKGTWTINYKFIWNINKIINYCCLVIS